ncbi:hypothetical protein VCRA2116O30_90130 [Vibrio crassostreae]|nr:hypothetical protein VCRA2117O37_100120 [Vibrio crassostreae]CAK1705823.1 hypothetical protein VCRA2116O31_100129 [Vibrio crassostreae]CAK2229963.1 hypothetical protein VCRA2119O47_70129 [Vibrio crassostreae]CAK2230793.1 hypothetical protein VCRA2119O46_70117 [Vibrio crassostreae]CAK2231619.1 hypothetical protein VCRA2116O28_70116 [Vibrio crassostreae]
MTSLFTMRDEDIDANNANQEL